jgi:DNA repair protein RadC
MTYQIISERKLKQKVKIENSGEVYKLVKRYAESKQEQFILLTLDGAHNVISISIVSRGTISRTIVHPREVYCRAITEMAQAIIVCHNHPSGSIIPSNEDKDVTLSLYEAGKIIGIPLLDHVIFSKTDHLSLKKHGFFPNEEAREAAWN